MCALWLQAWRSKESHQSREVSSVQGELCLEHFVLFRYRQEKGYLIHLSAFDSRFVLSSTSFRPAAFT